MTLIEVVHFSITIFKEKTVVYTKKQTKHIIMFVYSIKNVFMCHQLPIYVVFVVFIHFSKLISISQKSIDKLA